MWIPKAKTSWRERCAWFADIVTIGAILAFAYILLKIAE